MTTATAKPPRYPLPALVKHWNADAREELEERIAILVFDAHMSEERAKRSAELYVRERWGR